MNGNGRGARERNSNWKGGQFKTRAGYVKVLAPEHPHADPRGYVFEHVKVACEMLGVDRLPAGLAVHHINGQKDDNRRDNLGVYTLSGHMTHHQREIALRECGNPEWRKCAFCSEWDDPANLYINPSSGNARHRECFNRYQSERRVA